MHSPCTTYYSVALRVLRYLSLKPGQGLLMSSSLSFSLLAFCDVDWASCVDSYFSVKGFFISLGGSLISWKSKKQVLFPFTLLKQSIGLCVD